MYCRTGQGTLTNEYTLGPEACTGSLTRESLLVPGCSRVCVVNDVVLPVLLLQEHIGK
jgi:hypothetical protein